MSSKTLNRLFNKKIGMTFEQWRQQLKILRAIVLNMLLGKPRERLKCNLDNNNYDGKTKKHRALVKASFVIITT